MSACNAKEAAYDDRISPLMAQIIALCKEHNINMAAQFSLGLDPGNDETLYCTTVINCDKTDEDGYKRTIDCRRVMYPPSPFFAAFTITSGAP